MSVTEFSKISQDVRTQLARLSKANARFFLEERIKLLSIPRLNLSDRLYGIACSFEYYQLIDKTIKSKSKKQALSLASGAANSLVEENRLYATLKKDVFIHTGNFHIAESQFFEAASCFENALINEKDNARRIIASINIARCKLWLRDFSGVLEISRKASVINCEDLVLRAYIDIIRARFVILFGDYRKGRILVVAIFESLKDQIIPRNLAIELHYLKMVAQIMDNWKKNWVDCLKTFQSDAGKYLTVESHAFYLNEEALFQFFVQLGKNRKPSTVLTRKIASLKRQINDSSINELSSVILKLEKKPIKTDLDYRRVSLALRGLLSGAHDFTYQILSIIWLDTLWARGQRTEFARCEIEFRAYIENIKSEINVELKPDLWIFTELDRIQNLKKLIKTPKNSAQDFF